MDWGGEEKYLEHSGRSCSHWELGNFLGPNGRKKMGTDPSSRADPDVQVRGSVPGFGGIKSEVRFPAERLGRRGWMRRKRCEAADWRAGEEARERHMAGPRVVLGCWWRRGVG